VQIDSLRAIAALAVVGIHVGHHSGVNVEAAWGAFTSHLNVGVTLFFLITGFLLYRPWAVALLAGAEGPSIARYAKRRVLRIVPGYWVALTLLALWPGLRGVFGPDWWVYYGFAQSLRFDWTWSGLTPAWSLSVEAHYYALLPLYAAGVARLASGRSGRTRLRIGTAALAGLAGFGVAFCYAVARWQWLNLATSLPGLLLWFSAGMALALASAACAGREHEVRALRFVATHPGACWTLAAALYALLCLTPGIPRALSGDAYTPVLRVAEHVIYAAVSLLVMLPAVFGSDAGGLPRRVLGARLLSRIGVVSYGVFLWHLPLIEEMQRRGLDGLVPGWPFLSLGVLILPVAIACGFLSYTLIERPAMQLGRG
jgi:peptidoglycan/LPS O-acetylase OafA/YrhL